MFHFPLKIGKGAKNQDKFPKASADIGLFTKTAGKQSNMHITQTYSTGRVYTQAGRGQESQETGVAMLVYLKGPHSKRGRGRGEPSETKADWWLKTYPSYNIHSYSFSSTPKIQL